MFSTLNILNIISCIGFFLNIPMDILLSFFLLINILLLIIFVLVLLNSLLNLRVLNQSIFIWVFFILVFLQTLLEIYSKIVVPFLYPQTLLNKFPFTILNFNIIISSRQIVWFVNQYNFLVFLIRRLKNTLELLILLILNFHLLNNIVHRVNQLKFKHTEFLHGQLIMLLNLLIIQRINQNIKTLHTYCIRLPYNNLVISRFDIDKPKNIILIRNYLSQRIVINMKILNLISTQLTRLNFLLNNRRKFPWFLKSRLDHIFHLSTLIVS